MKKMRFMLLILCAAFFVGCGSDKPSSKDVGKELPIKQSMVDEVLLNLSDEELEEFYNLSDKDREKFILKKDKEMREQIREEHEQNEKADEIDAKYSSENMVYLDYGVDDIKSCLCIDARDIYFLTADNTLYTTERMLIPDMLDKVGKTKYKFDEIFPLESDEFLGLRNENKLYANGEDSFYYNPNHNIISFARIDLTDPVTRETKERLEAISLDEGKDTVSYQVCYPDGTIEEQEIYFKECIGDYDDYINNTMEEKFLSIRQIIGFSVDNRMALVLGNDGSVYSCYRVYDVDDNPYYDTSNKLYSDPESKIERVLNDLYLYTIRRNSGGYDYPFEEKADSLIYTKENDSKSIYLITDHDKRETLEFPLPEGYSTSDVVKVYHQNDEFSNILATFKDGSVYYCLEEDFINEVVDWHYSESLSAANKNGSINNLIRFNSNDYCVLMDDGKLYRIILE